MGRKKVVGLLGGAGLGVMAGGPIGAVVGGLLGTLLDETAERRDEEDEVIERRLETKHYACNNEDCHYEWISKKPFGRPGYRPRCGYRDIELVD